jgi:hypothetical protein
MASEPIEAALFTRPPALTAEQEEQYRTLEREGPLILSDDSASPTQVSRRSSLLITRTPTHQTLQRVSTRGSTAFVKPEAKEGVQVSVNQLTEIHRKEGFKVVQFDKGTGEDPREWGNGKKWCVIDVDSNSLCSPLRRFVTVSTSLLCLAVALGSSIVTGECVHLSCLRDTGLILPQHDRTHEGVWDNARDHQSHCDVFRHRVRYRVSTLPLISLLGLSSLLVIDHYSSRLYPKS